MNLRKEELTAMLTDISLRQIEDYDCSAENILAFRKKNDKWNGIRISLGNMCNGYPFEISGVPFFNSECAYIAGAYASDNTEAIAIQHLIAEERNGLKCKRKYRNSPYNRFMRSDWYEYNLQWMLYVVWQKSLQNINFADLLKRIPVDVQIVENSSFQNGNAATFWGAKNKELIALRKAAGKNSVNGVFGLGHYIGSNVMGKIIKICSLSMIYGQELPFDFNFLSDHSLTLFGNRLEFPVQ